MLFVTGTFVIFLLFYSGPVVFVPETKIGFFPPINAAKPVKELLDGGMEREKVKTEFNKPTFNPSELACD